VKRLALFIALISMAGDAQGVDPNAVQKDLATGTVQTVLSWAVMILFLMLSGAGGIIWKLNGDKFDLLKAQLDDADERASKALEQQRLQGESVKVLDRAIDFFTNTKRS